MIKKITTIGGLILMLSGVSAVYHGWYSGLAKADTVAAVMEEVSQNKDKIDKHEIKHRMNYLEERMWNLKENWLPMFKEEFDRCPNNIEELINYMTSDDRRSYIKWKMEYEELEKKLDG